MKKEYAIGGIAGIIVGVIMTVFTLYQMAPGMMMMEDVSSVQGFDSTVTRFEAAVAESGWKIPKVHDLQKTMKKFDKDVRAVKVFELCHPDHAGKILEKSDERIVSSLMPCRVAIYEKADGKVYVSRMNSSLMAGMMDGIIPVVMNEAAQDTEKILKSILN